MYPFVDAALRRAAVPGALLAVLLAPGVWAAGIDQVYLHGGFETGGVIVTLSADNDGDEGLQLEIREQGGAGFRPAHPFVRYDGHNYATSLFGLRPDTAYELRITLSDPDGVTGPNPVVRQLTTRAEPALPAPLRSLTVGGALADFPSLAAALLSGTLLPGDELLVAPGVYGPLSITGVLATAEAPLVIRALDPGDRPVIDGGGSGAAVSITRSAHVVIQGFEIRNGGPNNSGSGVRIQASAAITIQGNYIHDNGRYNVFVTQGTAFPGGPTQGGYHLIQDNLITDEVRGGCGGASNSPCADQTYYGIRLEDNPGAGTVIRRNEIHGHVDNAAVCGDESPGEGRNLTEGAGNVLALTGGADNRGWSNHNLDFYDNLLFDARDDDIEADGICVNARIFRNRFGAAQNPISVSPSLPGPYFFLRNVIEGDWGEAGIKFNTAGPSSTVAIRNLFFYHNTLARESSGSLLNLWYAVEGDHNLPVKNVVFRNNVMWAKNGGSALNCNNRGEDQPSFDYDLWYTPTTGGGLFCWWDGSQTLRAGTLEEFRLISGQEAHGRFEAPGLDDLARPLLLPGASAVVDRGLPIPGINDAYAGSAPDLGAFEVVDDGSGPDTYPQAIPSAETPTAPTPAPTPSPSPGAGSSGGALDGSGGGGSAGPLEFLLLGLAALLAAARRRRA